MSANVAHWTAFHLPSIKQIKSFKQIFIFKSKVLNLMSNWQMIQMINKNNKFGATIKFSALGQLNVNFYTNF